MLTTDERYGAYLSILNRELTPVTGCTEPVALAYAGAKGRELLGDIPSSLHIKVSGNIIKNTKSVVVPNSGGLVGIASAVTAGIIAGKTELGLMVISEVEKDAQLRMRQFLKDTEIKICQADSDLVLDIIITLRNADSYAKIRICNEHDNVVYLERDGKVLLDLEVKPNLPCERKEREEQLLSVEGIVDFVNSVKLDEVKDIIEKQIELNSAIAREGLNMPYGAGIGRLLMQAGCSVQTRARAVSAAASDARMNGCGLPVVILSGSGNQGITASLPIIEYAKELNSTHEQLIRAILLSDLITLHQKRYIGLLSAYCGAVCAGASCGAGIAYLYGGGMEEIGHTVINALAIASGMVCDGAKSSCAAKIAMSVEAGIMGYHMYKNGCRFLIGEGIVNSVEKTIQNVGVLGKEGMKETDLTILRIMLEDNE